MRSSSFSPSGPSSFRIQVHPAQSGERLDKWLSKQAGVHSREMARRLIQQGAVRLNTALPEPASRLRADDLVEFEMLPAAESTLEPEVAPLSILYEDEHLLVLDKVAGVTVHPGPGHATGTLVHHLLAHCDQLSGVGGVRRPGIVHRLDKDTSGVLCVAKTDRAHLGLQRQFQVHSIERIYRALTVGVPQRPQGTINLPLGRDPRHRLKQIVRSGGKPATTHWQIEATQPPFALLQMRLETGRTHQIRAHLAHSGYPILGDPLYGQGRHRGLALPAKLLERLESFKRQALHAAVLAFSHPETGDWMRFEAPLPEDFQQLVGWVSAYPPA